MLFMFIVADVLYIPDFLRTTEWFDGWKTTSGKSVSVSVIKSLSQSPLKSVGITGLCSHFSYLVKRKSWLLKNNGMTFFTCIACKFFLQQWGRERLYWQNNLSWHLWTARLGIPWDFQVGTVTTRGQTPLGSLQRLLRPAGKV